MTIENSGINISPSATVSCGSKAYWMASTSTIGRILVGYNADTGDFKNVSLRKTGEASVASDSRIQLGRVGGNIGIVLVKADRVELYVLLESANSRSAWVPFGFLNYRIPGAPVVQPNQDSFIGTPYPMRFEGSRLQVPLWVTHGHLLLWESNSIQRNRTRLVPVPLTPNPNRLASNPTVIAQGFPYVPSSYVPGTYRIIDTLDQEQLQEIAAHEGFLS
ncbi:uncharacterized protein A4U43_C08F26720 [Asparagus officinalis]|nr:uncharacterized protein A4U43_C08F26720 [Asparagus officinalis]